MILFKKSIKHADIKNVIQALTGIKFTLFDLVLHEKPQTIGSFAYNDPQPVLSFFH